MRFRLLIVITIICAGQAHAQMKQERGGKPLNPSAYGALEIVNVEYLSTPAVVVWRTQVAEENDPRLHSLLTLDESPRPLVILNHAAGQTEHMFLDLPPFRVLVDALVDAGFIVAASRLGDNPDFGYFNWGNQNALDANAELYAYLVAAYPVDISRVAMLGNSMGGLVTLLAFPDRRIPVRCAALYYPVTNLGFQHNFNAQMGMGIRYAYGVAPDGHDYLARTYGHDPALRSALDWKGKSLRFYGGGGDRLVPWQMHGGGFAAFVSGVAAENKVVELIGDHNAGVETTASDLRAFFGRCLR